MTNEMSGSLDATCYEVRCSVESCQIDHGSKSTNHEILRRCTPALYTPSKLPATHAHWPLVNLSQLLYRISGWKRRGTDARKSGGIAVPEAHELHMSSDHHNPVRSLNR